MSALGHKQTFAMQNPMSALHPKADMCGGTRDVRFVPIADMTLATPALSPWAAALTTHVGARKPFTNQNCAYVSSLCPQDCT